MFEPDFVTLKTDDITIWACQALNDGAQCGYYLRIENNSSEKIQLLGKELNITDDKGNVYKDYSLGFKGELPELDPGEYFEFENSALINASSAVLYGSCRIVKQHHNIQEIKIPALQMFLNQGSNFILN